MLDTGDMDTGIVAIEGFDYEIVEKGYRPCDNYSLLVTLKADGQVEKTVIGSIAESLMLDSENEKEYSAAEGNLPQSLPAACHLHHHRKGLQPGERQGRNPARGGGGLRRRAG